MSTYAGVCWYCYWGWPQPVREIYNRVVEHVGESPVDYGPAHVVWCDENFDDSTIESCIRDCDNPPAYLSDYTPAEIACVRQSLVDLLATPAEIRDCQPCGYDGENPELFPPPSGLVMVRA